MRMSLALQMAADMPRPVSQDGIWRRRLSTSTWNHERQGFADDACGLDSGALDIAKRKLSHVDGLRGERPAPVIWWIGHPMLGQAILAREEVKSCMRKSARERWGKVLRISTYLAK